MRARPEEDAFDKDTVTALVAENRNKKGLYGIKNVSKGVWRGLFPDGTTREIKRRDRAFLSGTVCRCALKPERSGDSG